MTNPLLLGFLLLVAPIEKTDYFTITVLDEQTGRGVPLVELRTVNQICYYTDSNGIVAFHEPGLMDKPVFFYVKSHGYEFAKDGFGIRGKALQIKPGGQTTLKIKRLNIAERLYRITGAGIYRDSLLVGRDTPLREPSINGLVFGSDSVINAVFRSKNYWFWGDTNKPAYPLGNFHVPGATSEMPQQGGLDPEVGVNLTYFVDDKGFARPTAQMPGDGPTWIEGAIVLRDRMFAPYMKIRPPLSVYARGLAEFDPNENRFRQLTAFKMDAPAYPGGHPFLHKDDGVEYVYFAKPYPLTRVRATPEDLKDLSRYETYTCLKQGSQLDKPEVERGSDGQLVYAWKQNTPAVGQAEQRKLIGAKLIQPHEALLQLRDRDTGKTVLAHGGSVYWNAYRRRWVMITVESPGTSFLGEVWYAEADTPMGPWTYAVKVVTHDRYSFYNPKQDPMFDKDGGRTIFFEGTYTSSFSGNLESTPRYEYNQVMYKLNLSDPQLALPVAVYAPSSSKDVSHFAVRLKDQSRREIAFYALDQPVMGMAPIYNESGALRVGPTLKSLPTTESEPLFYAFPADGDKLPATTIPLYEFTHQDGKTRIYSANSTFSREGFRRAEKPLCRVWKNPSLIAPKD